RGSVARLVSRRHQYGPRARVRSPKSHAYLSPQRPPCNATHRSSCAVPSLGGCRRRPRTARRANSKCSRERSITSRYQNFPRCGSEWKDVHFSVFSLGTARSCGIVAARGLAGYLPFGPFILCRPFVAARVFSVFSLQSTIARALPSKCCITSTTFEMYVHLLGV